MSGRDGKDYKQDMLVSIRYRNDLPPPPMPPKLLDIDTGGLQQYLDPGFAASIAKREEPNIEADAEGGMPIDVIGMYGYFDGDESCIMAPGVPMPLDPEDEVLMLTTEQLRAGGTATNTNFLRKTQYMTATAGAVNDPLRMTQGRARRMSAAKPTPMARDDKENIKRNIQKAFDLAYPNSTEKGPLPMSAADRSAWDNPVHPDPSKRHLKPVDFYPIMPDWEATTMSASSWHLLRFDKAPMPAVKGRRDDRLDAGLFMTQPDPTKQPAYDAAVKAYESDPKHYEHPGVPPITFTLFLPRDLEATKTIRTMFDSRNPEHANQDMMASVGEPSKNGQLRIPYERARFYANSKYEAKPEGFQTRQMIMALTRKDQKMAHYYPLSGVTLLKADRGKLGQSQRQPVGQEPDVDEGVPDGLMVLPREPTAQEMYNRYMQRDDYDPSFRAKFKDISRKADAERAEEEAAAEHTHSNREEGANGIEDDLEENGDVSMAESNAPPPQPGLISSTVAIDDGDDD